ncbi:enoyl-CoA hydratase-related protein [Aquimarina sp. 2201CG14-23]|uniref:enoyl-CoA hydratase-related protein n=1 Tax=Aquimarina mycalae TaxID=3040073 RepID=UPI00247829EF|nr:enoyl-CoA hydratase-related protein [Aquimarina sp. 2201CG14-23]MDH7447451.1 enoyl-CoA hydratase-related protein [Aquimarina sp. 2201CG14-23]
MDFFDTALIKDALNQKYAFVKLKVEDHVMTLTLDRTEKKNAIHPQMVQEIAFAMQFAKQTNTIRAIVIDAAGDVFCAGADLKAFMGIVGEFESSIPLAKEEVLIGELFNKVHKPIITKVEGKVLAGGFFFLAGANYVVCNEGITLGLPEVKRGLFPFQVMAALLEIMPKRAVVDWCIRGYDLDVKDAKNFGLITHITTPDTMKKTVEDILSDIKINSPTAIRLGLEALDTINEQASTHKYLMEMLQKTVSSKDGQEGLLAFRQKRQPVWTGE